MKYWILVYSFIGLLVGVGIGCEDGLIGKWISLLALILLYINHPLCVSPFKQEEISVCQTEGMRTGNRV